MSNRGPLSSTFHHVGMVVSDLEASMDTYIQNFGCSFFEFEVNQGNATLSKSSATFSLRLGIGEIGANLMELIQPVSGITTYSQHLQQYGPGLHHLGFAVTELNAARKQLADTGCTCIQDGSIRGLVDFSYYQGNQLAGIVEPLQFSFNLLGFLVQNARPYTPK